MNVHYNKIKVYSLFVFYLLVDRNGVNFFWFFTVVFVDHTKEIPNERKNVGGKGGKGYPGHPGGQLLSREARY